MSGIIACFGELMARIQPEGYCRIRQAFPGKADITFAGAEANVAASLRMLGRSSRFIGAIPDGPFGDAAIDAIRRFGIDTSHVVRGNGRLGLYFVERGANQRASAVIYDREGSLACRTPAAAYDWEAAFDGCTWFHISGITPSISGESAGAAQAAVKYAQQSGITVSCDLNFRKKLWNWESGTPRETLARRIMNGIMPYVDIVIGNEEDAQDYFGITVQGNDVSAGSLAIEHYPEIAARIVSMFPNVSQVAFTLRESVSASHNNWGAMLYVAATGKAFFAPEVDGRYDPYQIRNIVDRIGGGDSFSAGLIYALTDVAEAGNPPSALAFATAASCLCHSIEGDFNYVSADEVRALMGGDASGRVRR